MNKRNYILRVKYNKEVKRYATFNKRRFLYYTRLISWEKAQLVTLRVVYGKVKDIFGHMVTADNTGDYTNKKEFMLALNAFLE